MYDSYVDFAKWEPVQKIDIDKANSVATKLVELQGYITYNQAILCLGGASLDEIIDHDVRIWKPKTSDIGEWFYPI